MKQSQRIVKNVLAGGLSTALGGILQLAAVIVIARYVTVSEFGAYAFMAAFAFVLQRLADCGLSSILMRDLAIEREKIGEILGATLALAWLILAAMALLMAGTAAVIVPLFHLSRRLTILTAVMGMQGLGQFVAGCYGAVLRSQEDNEFHALGWTLHKVVLLGLTFAALAFGAGLTGVVLAFVVATLSQWWLFRTIVIRRYARPKVRVDLKLWKYLIRASVPVGGAGVVRLLGDQADVAILTWLAGMEAAGLFSGPYKISAGLRFLPQMLIIAIFPVYSRAAVAPGSQDFQEAYERSVKALLVMAFPVALLLLLCPETLAVGLLGTRYREATAAMRLLSVGAWLLFMSQPFPFLLTALNRQRFLFVSCAAALVLRIGFDLALTPALNFLAPCVSLMVSEGVLVAMWVRGLWQAGFTLPFLQILWRPCVASFVMGSLLYLAHPHSLLLLAAAALVCGVIYLAVVFKLGTFSKAELGLAREGLGFLRPLLAEWSQQAKKPS